MRIQIRQGVFETNSSSMHALALQKKFTDNCETCKDKYKDLIPEHITLEIEDMSPIYYSKNILEGENLRKCTDLELIKNKIILVYSNIIGRMLTMDDFSYEYKKYGYINLTMFFSWLTKLGITYDIPYQPDMFYVDKNNPLEQKDAFFCELIDDELWEHIFDGTEESFCNFLFGDGSKLDGYETDCGWNDKDGDKFWKKMKNGGKCEIFYNYGG